MVCDFPLLCISIKSTYIMDIISNKIIHCIWNKFSIIILFVHAPRIEQQPNVNDVWLFWRFILLISNYVATTVEMMSVAAVYIVTPFWSISHGLVRVYMKQSFIVVFSTENKIQVILKNYEMILTANRKCISSHHNSQCDRQKCDSIN